MTTKKRILTAALCILAVFVCAAPAGAELIIIGITAKVTIATDWDGFLGGAVHEGDIITGTYTYDTSTPDSTPGPPHPAEGHYLYDSLPFGISLKIGQLEFKTDPDNVDFVISINDNVWGAGSGPPEDYIYIYSVNNLLSPIETPVGYEIWLSLYGDSSAISGDALPAGAPVLSDWGGALLSISSPYNPNQAQQFAITAPLTDAFVIPEPATLGLVALGALALLRKRSST
jgi:hypothetical protein